MNIVKVLILLGLQCLAVSNGAKILAIESVAGKSHWNFLSSMLRELSKRHEITVITPFLDGNRENYTEINSSHLHVLSAVNLDFKLLTDLLANPASCLYFMTLLGRHYCQEFMNFEFVKGVLRGDQQFDLIIDETFYNPCLAHLGKTLGIPHVYVVASPMPGMLQPLLFGHQSNPSYEPSTFNSIKTPKGFYQRFANTILHVIETALPWLMLNVPTLWNPLVHDYERARHEPAMMFVNSHPVTDYPRAVPINMIEVGGLHLMPPKELPTDILEFIENSPHGVIYFTFGSVVSMLTLPEEILNAFKEALAQVPQRVLWKFEGEMKDKPDNVMTSKWFPQRDILLHPNVKLFISHGGISGVYEAVDAGVPVLGFPLFYDQPRNIANLVDAGMALSMDLFTVSKEPFLNAVLELINNKNYTINAKITSERFKDRPMTPAQSVIYWTEYVLRHKGAPHLRSQALNLTWYQYYLLDVIAAILLILSVTLYVIYKTSKFILKFVFKRPNKLKSKPE